METTLKTFPSNKSEALVMLYLQNKDISNLTPTELFNLYQKTYEEIKKAQSDYNKAHFNKQSFGF